MTLGEYPPVAPKVPNQTNSFGESTLFDFNQGDLHGILFDHVSLVSTHSKSSGGVSFEGHEGTVQEEKGLWYLARLIGIAEVEGRRGTGSGRERALAFGSTHWLRGGLKGAEALVQEEKGPWHLARLIGTAEV